MLLYLYMLCFSQATVSVKISNFVSVVFMSYPIDNLKKRKCYRRCVYCIILLNSGFWGVFFNLVYVLWLGFQWVKYLFYHFVWSIF